MSNLNNELTFLYIFSFHKTSMSRLIRFIKEKVCIWIDFDIVTQIPEIIQLVIPKDKKLHYLFDVRLHQYSQLFFSLQNFFLKKVFRNLVLCGFGVLKFYNCFWYQKYVVKYYDIDYKLQVAILSNSNYSFCVCVSWYFLQLKRKRCNRVQCHPPQKSSMKS